MPNTSELTALVTGGAGFVGSHLVDRLLEAGVRVVVFDSLEWGNARFLHHIDEGEHSDRFSYCQAALTNEDYLLGALQGCDVAFHLAANADIRHGIEHPDLDFQQNVEGTRLLLSAMRKQGVQKIVFASTGAVYGNQKTVPIPEDCPFPVQNSFYGASKVAAEALLTAYCSAFDMRGWIFRFVPMLGERYSHGHIFDFVKKLKRNPDEIEVFGDGSERKYSLYVHDAIDAVIDAFCYQESGKLNIYNVGSDKSYSINEAVQIVASILGVNPKVNHTNSRWVGDNPNMHLDSTKIRSISWTQNTSAKIAIYKTVQYILEHEWMLGRDS